MTFRTIDSKVQIIFTTCTRPMNSAQCYFQHTTILSPHSHLSILDHDQWCRTVFEGYRVCSIDCSLQCSWFYDIGDWIIMIHIIYVHDVMLVTFKTESFSFVNRSAASQNCQHHPLPTSIQPHLRTNTVSLWVSRQVTISQNHRKAYFQIGLFLHVYSCLSRFKFFFLIQ